MVWLIGYTSHPSSPYVLLYSSVVNVLCFINVYIKQNDNECKIIFITWLFSAHRPSALHGFLACCGSGYIIKCNIKIFVKVVMH